MQRQPDLPVWQTLRALGQRLGTAWRLFRDPRVPLWTKALLVVALAYVLWPVDVLPDPLLGLGQLDDITVLLLAVEAFLRLCPEALRQAADPRRPYAVDKSVEGQYRVLVEIDVPQDGP